MHELESECRPFTFGIKYALNNINQLIRKTDFLLLYDVHVISSKRLCLGVACANLDERNYVVYAYDDVAPNNTCDDAYSMLHNNILYHACIFNMIYCIEIS